MDDASSIADDELCNALLLLCRTELLGMIELLDMKLGGAEFLPDKKMTRNMVRNVATSTTVSTVDTIAHFVEHRRTFTGCW